MVQIALKRLSEEERGLSKRFVKFNPPCTFYTYIPLTLDTRSRVASQIFRFIFLNTRDNIILIYR
jgi:hypothetical protein